MEIIFYYIKPVKYSLYSFRAKYSTDLLIRITGYLGYLTGCNI